MADGGAITPDDIQGDSGGNRHMFGFSQPLKEVQPSVEGSIRLLQQTPAWGLHLLLRVNGLNYTTENVPFPVALGHRLPLLIRGNMLCTEMSGISSCETLLREFPVNEDSILASYISSLRAIAAFVAEISDPGRRRQHRTVRALGSRMLEWYYDGFGDMSSPPSFYFGWSEKKILNHLSAVYAYIDAKLKTSVHLTLSGVDKPGTADAVLFTHVLETRHVQKIVDVMQPFASIHESVSGLLDKYFSSSDHAQSNQQLGQNRYLLADSELCARLFASDMGEETGICPVDHDILSDCRRPRNFVFDFSVQNFIPWKAQEYERVNGEDPVVINLRTALFTSIVASSFCAYFWRAAFRHY